MSQPDKPLLKAINDANKPAMPRAWASLLDNYDPRTEVERNVNLESIRRNLTMTRKPMTPFNEEAQEKYLRHLAATGRKAESALVAGVTARTIAYFGERVPEFKEVEEAALEIFRDFVVESEVQRRAVEGWDEPVFYQGIQTGEVRKYSDRLLEMFAKRHVPAYREKVQADVNITGGVLVVGAKAESTEEWMTKFAGAVPVQHEILKAEEEKKDDEPVS